MTTTQVKESRTQEDWDRIVSEDILPRLQDGGAFTTICQEYGAWKPVREALARAGYDPKGQPAEYPELTARRRDTLAKRVAARRADGAAWWRLELETGKPRNELRALLRDQGYQSDGARA